MGSPVQPSFGPGVTALIDRLRAVGAGAQFGPEPIRDLLADALTQDGDWLDQACQQRDGDPVGKAFPLYRAPDGRLSVLAVCSRPAHRPLSTTTAPGPWSALPGPGARHVVPTRRRRWRARPCPARGSPHRSTP